MMSRERPDWRREAVAILATCLATLVALRWAVGPQVFDITIPFSYSGDGLSHGVLIKSLLEEGWFPAFNRHLGAPFIAAQFDYPGTDALQYLILKLIGLITRDWARVEDIFVLTGFVLTAASAYLALRALRLHRALAVAGGVLYALLPFHMLRVEHPFLAAYFCVPLAIWLALEFIGNDADRKAHTPPMSRAPMWQVAVAAAIIGASGVYYATFALLIIVAAGLVSLTVLRARHNALRAIVACAIIVLVVTLTVAPTMWYRATEGTNAEVIQRDPAESERYGLSLAELVFPRIGHRNHAAREFANRYHAQAGSNLERETAALGAVPTLGLILLVGALLVRLAGSARSAPFDRLAFIVTVCFIVGTIGGLGSVIAWTVSPLIRAYSRISVFIGFCSLAAVLLGLQGWLQQIVNRRSRRMAFASAAIVLTCIGVLDQTSPSDFRRDAAAREFASDRDFVRKAESFLPRDTAIYQLPYHRYPEAGPLHAMADYDLFRGYLHAVALRWSHGNIKGRIGDAWQRQLADRPTAEQLAVARESGFGAVYVDRRGFADHAKSIESEIQLLAGAPALVSSDGNLALYSLAGLNVDIRPAAQWGELVDLSDVNMKAAGLSSFGPAERWGRWTMGHYAHIVFLRPLPSRFVLELEVVTTLRNGNGNFVARVGSTERTFEVNQLPAVARLEFDSPGDGHTVTLRIPRPVSPAEVGMDATDRRLLGLGIKYVRVIPLPGNAARASSAAIPAAQKETPLARGS